MNDNEIKPTEDMRLSVICREVDKRTGEITTYVCRNDVTTNELSFFSLRGMLNPELTYYTVLTRVTENQEQLEDILLFLKRRNLSNDDVKRYGGIIKIVG